MTLTDFLLARIADDETIARKAHPSGGDDAYTSWVCCEFMHVAIGEDRMLAECESKRRIVEEYESLMSDARARTGDLATSGALLALHGVIKLLALPYADHPSFNESWRP